MLDGPLCWMESWLTSISPAASSWMKLCLYLTLVFFLLSHCNLCLNVIKSEYVSTTGVSLANSSNMLHKLCNKDSISSNCIKPNPTPSFTPKADSLLLYSTSVSVPILISQCFCGWFSFGLVVSRGQMRWMFFGVFLDGGGQVAITPNPL